MHSILWKKTHYLVHKTHYWSVSCARWSPIVSSTPIAPKWVLSFRYSYQIFVCKACFPHARYISCPSCVPWYDHLNNIWPSVWGSMLQTGRSRDRVTMRWIFSNLPNISGRTVALGSTQPLTEMSTRNLKKKERGGKVPPARRADNLAAIY
jgi:hypothetical protein